MEKVLKRTLVILIYIGLILLNTKVYATTNNSSIKEGYTAKAETDLNIKLLPTINSESIEQIKEGTEYKVLEVLNKWCHIESENSDGWIFISKLGDSEEVKQDNADSEEETQEKEEDNEENNQSSDEQDNEQTENEDKNEEEIKEKETVKEDSKESDSSKDEDDEKEESNESDSKEVEEKSTESSKASGETKYVSVDTLNVRDKADSKGKIIDQLDLNDKITVQEIVNDSWAKIQINGKTGYVSTKYLSDKKTVITSRSGETERENKTEEQDEEQNEVQDNSIKDNSNVQQEVNQNSNNNSSSASLGAQVVEYAKQYLGYKYVSGGSSPSSGFDCSGFTCYVYKHFGITLNRVSGAQASNGVAVDRDNLQLGDIILFNDNNNSKIGHVGIYIGGNQFIHAANAKKGVITTSLSDSYYSKRYVGARRVI